MVCMPSAEEGARGVPRQPLIRPLFIGIRLAACSSVNLLLLEEASVETHEVETRTRPISRLSTGHWTSRSSSYFPSFISNHTINKAE